MRVVFVHGACVRDGAWWWHRTAELLAGRGISSVAPALPSCGETGSTTGAEGPGLAQDVEAVQNVLRAADEPTLVVAHSYGGIVASEAVVAARHVTGLLLVSSYLPLPGESLSTFGADTPPPFLAFNPDLGTFTARPDTFEDVFAQDCPPDLVEGGKARLIRQSMAVLQAPVRAAGWQELPTTYLVCADDRGTPASSQREFARRAGTVVEAASGHHPFLSQPVVVADVVVAAVARS